MKMDMKDFLYNIAVSGGGSGGGYPEPTGTKNINQNGNNIDVKDYATANVNVPNSYTAQDEGKVVSNGALVSQTSRNITQNGTVDTTLNNEVVVNVPSQTPTLVSKSITENGTYNPADDNADGYSEVTVAVQAVSREDEIIRHNVHGEYTNASVTTIGNYAFYECQNLTSVSLPEATKVDAEAFSMCSRLASANLPKVQMVGNKAFKDTALHQLSLPACKSVNSYAFSEARSLESVSIPNVTNISSASSLFEYCSKLREIEIGAITKIPSNCFASCSSLESVDFKEVTQIESSAFSNCSKLESVDFPLITLVPGNVFQNCTALTSVNLPSVIQCGYSAFNGCKSLVNIVLPACTALSSFAFLSCSALETVDLPVCKNLNFSGIFQNCTNLKAVILRSTDGVVQVMSNAFNPSGISAKTGYIYVPAALVDAYKVATNWKTYANQFRALEDYTVDGTVTGALDPNKI